MSYHKGRGGEISIEEIWVEFASGEAWRAETRVSVVDMERSASGAIRFMPILAPGGC